MTVYIGSRSRRSLLRIVFFLVTTFFLASLLRWIWKTYLVQVTSIAYHYLWQWSLLPCGFLKTPFIQLIGTDSVMLMWETNCRFDDVQVFYARKAAYRAGPKQQLRNDEGMEHRLAATSIEVLLTGKNRFTHRVYLTNLATDSIYFYTVRLRPDEVSQLRREKEDARGPSDATPFTDSFYFPGDQVERVSLAILSDNHGGLNTFNQLLHSMMKHKPEIFVHVGDMVNDPSKAHEWQRYFFDSITRAGISDRIPSIIAMGNHDVGQFGPADYFAPSHQLGSAGAYHCALTLGPLRVIVVDSTREEEAQMRWLEGELASGITQRSTFRVVIIHFPPFIEFWDPKTWKIHVNQWSQMSRTRLITMLEKNRVDLVLSGHQHNYQRGFRNGVHYITCGGAGGQLDTARVENHGVYKVTKFVNHFISLHANSSLIEVNAYNVRNHRIDQLSIPKNVVRRYRAAEQ